MKHRVQAVLRRLGLLTTAVTVKRSLRRAQRTARRAVELRRRRVDLESVSSENTSTGFVGHVPVVAETIDPGARFDPLDERAHNLELVLRCCSSSTSTHFVSRSPTPGRTRVGVVGTLVPLLDALQREGSGGMIGRERDDALVDAVPLLTAPDVLRSARASDVLVVFRPLGTKNPDHVVDGLGTGCEIELWETSSTTAAELTSPVPNPVSNRMAAPAGTGRLDVPQFTWQGDDWDPPFEIDAVYTWVDGNDPAWKERQRAHRPVDAASDGATAERFEPFDELRHSLRSLHQHMPFVNNIYLVTDRQRPDWLVDDAGVTVVDHTEIFRPTDALPVFNSHAIESQLHRVPQLAEHYVYLNDDVFFGRNVAWTNLFTVGGLARFAESRARIPINPLPDDRGVDHSGANAQALLVELVGRAPSRKIKHTPHPQLRSVHEELEQRIPDVYERVARSRFRSVHDISLAVLFHHRYAESTGRAIPGAFDYDYVNLDRPDLEALLGHLAERRPMTFCLNDADLSSSDRARVRVILDSFLTQLFPLPAPWERTPRTRLDGGADPAASNSTPKETQ